MPTYKYLIIGGGMTGASAIQGIRKIDRNGTIGLIGSECHPPYNRPPLTKGLWKGDSFESIWRNVEMEGLALHLGRTAVSLEPENGLVVDDEGTPYFYDRLLLATGAAPRALPFGKDQIIYFRTLDDYERLRTKTETGKRFGVIGGGFIGAEIAAALAMNGKEVLMSFPDDAICGRMLPTDLAHSVNDYFSKKGIEVLSGTAVDGCELRDGKAVLRVRNKKDDGWCDTTVDGVVAGIGVCPNTELAASAGLEVEDGIRVDGSLRTNHPNIFAAGDVASVYNSALSEWRRVEHEDNANAMGEVAGRNMAGAAEMYNHIPFFYSDLFELGYEAVGEVDSRLDTVADWKTPFREGVVYYLREGRIRGVLLWNVWEQVDAARKLITMAGTFTASDIKGLLPV